MKHLFDYDPLTGAVEHVEFDHSENRTLVHRSADVQPIIDRNKELANHTDGRHPVLGWHAASIPIDVALIWLERFGVKVWDKAYWPEVRRLLNSNEWRYLRVKHFIV